MSVRSEVKELIPHFTHEPEYLEERMKFRGLMRTLETASYNMQKGPKKRRKKSGNTSASEIQSQGESESS